MRGRCYKRTRRALRRSILNASVGVCDASERRDAEACRRALEIFRTAVERLRRFNRLHKKG